MEGKVFLSTTQAAGLLGLSPRTLEKWRINGGSPPFHKFGRRVLYSREDLEYWAAACRRKSTSDPGPGSRQGSRAVGSCEGA